MEFWFVADQLSLSQVMQTPGAGKLVFPAAAAGAWRPCQVVLIDEGHPPGRSVLWHQQSAGVDARFTNMESIIDSA